MTIPTVIDINLVEILLNTTYGITSFVIAQALAYLYAIEKMDIRSQIIMKKVWVLRAIIAFHFVYIGGVILCQYIIQWIVCETDVKPYYFWTFLLIGCGQVIIILLFSSFAYFITKTLQPKKEMANN
jgi:hypothetical protein